MCVILGPFLSTQFLDLTIVAQSERPGIFHTYHDLCDIMNYYVLYNDVTQVVHGIDQV